MVSVVNGDSTAADADTRIAMVTAARTGTKGDTFEILVTFTDDSSDNSTNPRSHLARRVLPRASSKSV